MSEIMHYYLSCRIGREWYGIDGDAVLKVLYFVALTELPNAAPDMLGLLTLPDRVIPVIDLRRRFGLTEAALRLDTPIVCIDTPNGAVGLVVDEADDIVMVSQSQIAAYHGAESPYITGAARQPDYLMLLLDMSMLTAETQAAMWGK